MYFYLLLASFYIIRSKSKIFIHSFISCWFPCPNEWFQIELFWRKYNKKLNFRIQLLLLAIVLRCWNPVEYIQKIIISFLTVRPDEINYGVRHKLRKIQNQSFTGVLQNSQKYTFVEASLIIRLQVNFDKNFMRKTYERLFLKKKDLLLFKIDNKDNSFLVNCCIVKWPKRH